MKQIMLKRNKKDRSGTLGLPRRRGQWLGILAISLTALLPLSTRAAYPDRPVRVIVGYAPGGPTDAVARMIFAKVSEQLKQTFVIENKAGANGNIGMQTVARSEPDGYTVLYATSGVAINPSLYKSNEFAIRPRMEPVMLVASIPQLILVPPSSGVNTAQEWLNKVKTHPDEYFFASSGVGNGNHLAMHLLLDELKLKAAHVAYKGSAPALTDLMAGRAEFMLDTVNTTMPLVTAGRLKAIAIGSAKRLPMAPDVPTISETLLPGFEAGTWHGLWVPGNTPKDVIETLNKAVATALKDPELSKQLEGQGVVIEGSTPEKFGEYYDTEFKRWAKVIGGLNIDLN